MLTPVIVIQLSALRVNFLSTFVLEPAATLGWIWWRWDRPDDADPRLRAVYAPPGAHRPEDGGRLSEGVFSVAGNRRVLPITHRSEGVDRVNRVVGTTADEMTAEGNPNMIGVR